MCQRPEVTLTQPEKAKRGLWDNDSATGPALIGGSIQALLASGSPVLPPFGTQLCFKLLGYLPCSL